MNQLNLKTLIPVKVKKLHPDAVIPKYQTDGAAGFDFHAIEDVKVEPSKTTLVKTGLSFEIPEGYELQVVPRSGMSLKTPVRIANSPGTVDSDYRGEVCIIVDNRNEKFIDPAYEIKKGDRIAQGKITPVVQARFQEVEELGNTERGEGGFGSTGTS